MSTIISPTNSRLSFATRANVFADNTAVVAIKISVRDTGNQPVAGRVVEVTTIAPGVSITQAEPTDTRGTAIAYAKSRIVGTALFQGRILPDRATNDKTGAIQIENTITANFYAKAIEPAPQLQTTARNIHLTWSISRYVANNVDGIRVRIEADQAALMPTKIFAYQLLPIKPGESEPVGMFDHICSPVDLEEFPEDAPLIHSRPQWFRLNYVDVLLRSREETREFINSVVEDVKILKDTIDITEELVPAGNLWIGTPPPEDN